jgi:hypothetical protein
MKIELVESHVQIISFGISNVDSGTVVLKRKAVPLHIMEALGQRGDVVPTLC